MAKNWLAVGGSVKEFCKCEVPHLVRFLIDCAVWGKCWEHGSAIGDLVAVDDGEVVGGRCTATQEGELGLTDVGPLFDEGALLADATFGAEIGDEVDLLDEKVDGHGLLRVEVVPLVLDGDGIVGAIHRVHELDAKHGFRTQVDSVAEAADEARTGLGVVAE